MEFWGNFFLAAAKGQKQTEDMARWMAQGVKATGLEDVAAMFRRAYGLKDSVEESTPDRGLWEAAARQFKRAFEEYVSLMGMVSSAEHSRLQKKCEALEKKCAEQEETIAHLRKLLGVGKAGQEEVVKKFQDIIEKQSTQFKDLVVSSTRFLKEAATPSKRAGKRG